MFVLRPDQGTVPLPATGFGRLDEHEHQAPVKVRGKPAEHSFGEER